MSSLAEPRQQAILELLNTGGQAVVSELARRFDVSEMTIRRDLSTLEEMGLAVRVHGGAIAGEKSRFTSRLSTNSRAKAKAVAKLVAELPNHGCIYFDGSTTVLNLVKHLKGFTRLQVATNNVETFNRLAAIRGPSPILIGGTFDPRTDNLIGPLALRTIEALSFEKAFFSAWGLNVATGLNEATVEDAQVKALVALRTPSVFVAVDHSKFGVTAAGTWMHGGGASLLSTDLPPDDGRLAPFRDMFDSIV
jgi:Transcriptional regulators of sugar metabolism